MNSNVTLSIVVPIYNEEESLPFLVNQLLEVLEPMEETFELVLVNDGSSDDSAEVIRKLSFEIPELVGVLLRKNYGQTAAMAAGFDISSGHIVVTLDGDLQNDPADIPLLVNKIRDGFDLVSGWRYRILLPSLQSVHNFYVKELQLILVSQNLVFELPLRYHLKNHH